MSAEQIGRDAGGFVNGRQAASRMCAAADQIAVLKFLESVMRPPVEHLRQGMGKIELGRFEDMICVLPFIRSYAARYFDLVFEISESAAADDGTKDLFIERFLFFVPVNPAEIVRYRDKHVHRGFSFRRERRVGHTGVLNIKREIIGQSFRVKDIIDICVIVFGEVDRVMVKRISFLQTEIEHER